MELKKEEVKGTEEVKDTSFTSLRYSTDGVQVKRVSYTFGLITPKYDSIVDRSNFSIDADRENVRKSMLSGGSLLSDNAYDNLDNPPSDLEVKLRSGKFDKAEVQMIQKNLVKEVSDAATEKDKEVAQKKLDKINQARQEHLDKMVGFTSQPEKQ